MNSRKREKLKNAIDLLERASALISDVLDDEQDCLDNMPENLQSSEKYERMEAAISSLEESIEQIDNAKDGLENAAE